MLKRISLLAWFLTPLLCGAAQTCVVPDSLWDRPRSGQVVATLPELRNCVQSHLAKPDSALLIHHAVADESTLRATEMRYWLMALALDGARINLSDDLQPNQPLRVEVREQ
jgi:hypothetical protein